MPDNKLTLYEISKEGQFIQNCLIEFEGEISPELESRLDALMIAGPDKIQAAGHVLANLEYAVAARKMEAARMAESAKAMEAGIDRLKARMVAALDMAFNGKLQTDTHTYWTQKGADTYAVVLGTDESGAEVSLEELQKERPDFVRTKLELDKTAIQNAYKQEQPLPDSIFVNPKPPSRYLRVR